MSEADAQEPADSEGRAVSADECTDADQQPADSDFDPAVLRRCLVIAGPTAAGKTAAALELADQIQGEIVSMDSMAVYTGMDIGTAKPDSDERARVPHHLIDVAHPSEEFSLAEYLRQAVASVKAIESRGRTAVFVGGTGLYLRSLLRGVQTGPPGDPELRRRLHEEAAVSGGEALLSRLRDVDPETAGRLHANDIRRIIRAFEVAELTGRPMSAFRQHSVLPAACRMTQVYWLHPDRQVLRDRINRRTELMIKAGWLEETRRLLTDLRPPGRTASQAVGYRELISLLRSSHEPSVSVPEETIDRIRAATRQLAKRQLTWFRNLKECIEVPVGDCRASAQQVAEQILRAAEAAD